MHVCMYVHMVWVRTTRMLFLGCHPLLKKIILHLQYWGRGYVGTHATLYLWGSENNLWVLVLFLSLWDPRAQTQVVRPGCKCPELSCQLHFVFWFLVFSLSWNSPISPGWFATEPQGSTVCLPSTEITSLCHGTQFYVGSGTRTA